jgi:hypothetical protein
VEVSKEKSVLERMGQNGVPERIESSCKLCLLQVASTCVSPSSRLPLTQDAAPSWVWLLRTEEVQNRLLVRRPQLVELVDNFVSFRSRILR